jgi:hypothetical protein
MNGVELEFGDELEELRDSGGLLGDADAMHERLAADGYLYLPGFHDVEAVRAARAGVLEHMAEAGMLDDSHPVDEAVVAPDYDGGGLVMDSGTWAEYPAVLDVVEGEATMDFFDSFVGHRALSYDYKWGRAKPPGGHTGFHCDKVFMGRGTDDVYTLWTPLGDVPLEMGPLVICPGACHSDRLRETYGRMDVDRDNFQGSFSEDPLDVIDTFGGPLLTTDFEMGDVLLFGQYNLHGALANRSDRFRISVDTRYQSVAKPVDGRWVGTDPIAHYAWTPSDATPTANLREEWGL